MAPVGVPTAMERLISSSGVFQRHGDTPLQALRTRATNGEVGSLIARAPQLGANRSSDSYRCAGAAVVNGMLLEGSLRLNARALRAVATTQHALGRVPAAAAILDRLDPPDRTSAGGTQLTPRELATLQELAHETMATYPGGSPRLAMGVQQVEPYVSALAAAGAFPTGTVRLMNRRDPEVNADTGSAAGLHWTVAVSGPLPDAWATSWPNELGYSTVGRGVGPAAAVLQNSPNFECDITVRRHRPDAAHPLGAPDISRSINTTPETDWLTGR